MSAISDVAYLIEHESLLGLSYGVNMFKGPKAKIPNGDGPYVSLIKAGGLGTDGTHNLTTTPAYERPLFQVVVRATDYDVAETLIDALHPFLGRVRNRFINGTWWVSLRPRSEPYDLTPDEKGRPRIACMFDTNKRVSPATSI